VRYRGQIGEFKVGAFILAFILCLVFGLLVHRNLKFATEPSKDEVKAAADAATTRTKQLEDEVKLLRSQVSSLQNQLDTKKRTKTRKNNQ
jgi:cell division protein FtsB